MNTTTKHGQITRAGWAVMAAETAEHSASWEDRFAASTAGRTPIVRDLDTRAAEYMSRAEGGVR